MTPGQAAFLVVAGICAGLSGSIAGLASLFSYPALLAVCLNPVVANVTNTIALVFNSIGSVTGSRPELEGQRDRVLRLSAVGTVGGIVGGILLLTTSPVFFERIVPWLIGIGSLSILWQRRPVLRPDVEEAPESWPVMLGVFLIGVYGGYFGAAAGVLLMALLLASSPQSLARCNALKNIILGFANGIAAVIFVFFGKVAWAAAAPMAVGLYIGGRIGPTVVRRSPARALRIVIAVAGVGLAFYLGLKG